MGWEKYWLKEVRHFSVTALPLYIPDVTSNEMLLCPGSGFLEALSVLLKRKCRAITHHDLQLIAKCRLDHSLLRTPLDLGSEEGCPFRARTIGSEMCAGRNRLSALLL